MTSMEHEYIDAYRNILLAIYDVEKYVSSSLRTQVDSLEARMSADEIERLRNIARGEVG